MSTFPTPDDRPQPGAAAQNPPKRRRFRRNVVRAASAIGILALLGVVALYGVGLWAYFRCEAKINQLRAAGQPVDVDDLKSEPIPADQAANTYLAQATGGLKAIDTAFASLDDADQSQLSYCNRLTPRAAEVLAKALADHADVFPLLERAAGCARFEPQLRLNEGVDAYLESTGMYALSIRVSGEALWCQALLLLADGKSDDALRNALTALRLAQCVEPYTRVDLAVANSCRQRGVEIANLSLRTGKVDGGLQDALDAELARATPIDSFRAAMSRERAAGALIFREVYGKWNPQWFFVPFTWRVAMNDHYGFLCSFDAPIELVDRPYREVRDRLQKAEDAPADGVIAALMSGAAVSVALVTYDDVARIRSLRVFSALVRRAAAGQSDEPTLADLGLPSETTVDPFTGDPLKLKPLESGWVVYSVGRDLKDEGGKLGMFHDTGVGPRDAMVDENGSSCGSE